jgi:hypothetical protein
MEVKTNLQALSKENCWFYFPDAMWLPSEENLVVTLLASVGMTVTNAKPMAAAIRPYSMAVAPDSSPKNFVIL